MTLSKNPLMNSLAKFVTFSIIIFVSIHIIDYVKRKIFRGFHPKKKGIIEDVIVVDNKMYC